MSDNFVQQAALGSGTTTASATLNGVTAGNAIVVVGSVGSNFNPTLHSVSDGTSYTAGNSAQDATNNIFAQAFYLLNAGAGTHVVVFTSDVGASCDIFVAEIGTSAGASAAVDTKANQQTSPGTGTDAIISGSLTIAAAATVWAVSLDTTSANAGDEPVVGTSPFAFTTRQNGVSGNSGAYRAESAAAGANGSATATAANGPAGAHNYVTVAIAVANASAGSTVSPGAGTLTLAGLAPSVLLFSPPPGALTLSGLAPNVVPHFGGQLFTVGQTADDFSVVGGAALVGGFAPDTSNSTVAPDVGSLLLQGRTPTAVVSGGTNTNVSPGAGTLTLTGLAPTLFRQDMVSPGAGSLTLTGLAPTRIEDSLRTPGAGTLTLNGLAPTLFTQFIALPGAGSLLLTGLAPVALQDSLRTPGAGALVLSGLAPTVATTANVVASPSSGTLTLSGLAPTIAQTANVTASPAAGALTLNGLTPTLAVSDNVIALPSAGALVLTGQPPAIQNGGSLTAQPDAGALLLTGLAPTLQQTANQTVTPAAGSLLLNGAAPALDLAIAVPAGTLTLAGLAPNAAVTAHQTVTPDTGALMLSGYAPVVTSPLEIQVPAGELTLNGLAPKAVNSGDIRPRRSNPFTAPKYGARRKRRHPNIVFKPNEPMTPAEFEVARREQIAESQGLGKAPPVEKPKPKASGLLTRLMQRVEQPVVSRETIPRHPAPVPKPVKAPDARPSAPKPEHPSPPPVAEAPPPKPKVKLPSGVEEALAEMRAQLQGSIDSVTKELERERGLRVSAEETLRANRERDRRKRNQQMAAQLAARLLVE